MELYRVLQRHAGRGIAMRFYKGARERVVGFYSEARKSDLRKCHGGREGRRAVQVCDCYASCRLRPFSHFLFLIPPAAPDRNLAGPHLQPRRSPPPRHRRFWH
ncbi:hypothetical protein E2C01_036060 [Portunus trituberculatus]|uniref:Uncharacterized protein n=1 Tax=Portunus trituberculatus TaxID=210409 RepID=A0A5B7FBF3_PORTR|nr:hypothetical protein [Portunus trituberculatus]